MRHAIIGLLVGMSLSAAVASDAPVIVRLQQRVELIERFLSDADTAHTLGGVIAQQDYRIKELERKVGGMQGAINRLFARVEKLEGRK